AGVFVYLIDSNEKRGRDACEMLRNYGHHLQRRTFIHMDSAEPLSGQSIVREILGAHDGIDIFVNISTSPSSEISDQNASLLKAFLPSMIANTRGKIISVTSGFHGAGSDQDIFDAEGEVTMETTSDFAIEMGRYGISVNCIRIEHLPLTDHESLRCRAIGHAFASLGSNVSYPPEIADTTLLFARASSHHMTGQTIQLNY
ncbi:MAG: SDR family oxidoreductase, partial [Fimbriimonadaceae bacterium]|nr:SDR family oxidoreductase [Alphaproteobacteria bacterium]